jgi:FtsZ-interacting cell division protein YlmF
MRASFVMFALAALCIGCARPDSNSSSRSDRPTEETRHAGSVPAAPQPPAMTTEEITALVRSVVAEELSRQNERRTADKSDDARQQAEQQAAIEAGEKAAQKAAADAQQAAEAARHAAEEHAAREALAERQQAEALARFLLLPDESARVQRIAEKLKDESIWSLTLQDLDFAATGFAAPLLHDALFAAAERTDPNIEMDVLAKDAGLTTDEKIQLATMPPFEREQLLTFSQQLKQGQKTVEGDRYIREYINRYPFIRKIVLQYVHEKNPAP